MKHYSIHCLVVLAMLFFFTGCNGDDNGPTEPEVEGSFSLSLSGDIEDTLTGDAIFGSGEDPETGEGGFVLIFRTEIDETQAGPMKWFLRVGATRPGTGEYPIGNAEELMEDNWDPEVLYSLLLADQTFLSSDSGVLDVNTSSSNLFAGSFEYTASAPSPDDPEEQINVTIDGWFEAVGGDIDWPEF